MPTQWGRRSSSVHPTAQELPKCQDKTSLYGLVSFRKTPKCIQKKEVEFIQLLLDARPEDQRERVPSSTAQAQTIAPHIVLPHVNTTAQGQKKLSTKESWYRCFLSGKTNLLASSPGSGPIAANTMRESWSWWPENENLDVWCTSHQYKQH